MRRPDRPPRPARRRCGRDRARARGGDRDEGADAVAALDPADDVLRHAGRGRQVVLRPVPPQPRRAERAAGQRATDDAEVQGFHHSGGYTVRPGDNLWQIASRLYGDGRYWVYLYSANADQIRNPNLIHPGQTLRLL